VLSLLDSILSYLLNAGAKRILDLLDSSIFRHRDDTHRASWPP
jgi:hypothetical protein